MISENYIHMGVLLFCAGAFGSLLPFPKAKGYLYLLSCIGAVSFGAAGLSLSSGVEMNALSFSSSSLFEFSFRGDALSGFFVTMISLLTIAVSLYSVGYVKDMSNKGLMGVLFPLFILSMYAVVLAGNIFTFLLSWESMSIISYFLVTFDREEKSARAGLIYAVMTHIGTAFIIALFLVLYKYTGAMEFAGMKAGAGALPETVKTVVFLFALVGFGTKAGIIPLHTWLPRAHPAAPSSISSLMSGVMIKTGIYGFLRISMDMMGGGPVWWGIAVIVIGAVSSVLGVLYALMENDIKRLLAYSSVENIGIIFLGIGASLLFRSNGLHVFSAIALMAALYHTLNHAAFKGLLFLGAGSVMHAAHTKNMEDMGGLLKRMPYTGALFLAGSVSICALPPFNGFASEWLTYQALLLGFKSPSVAAKIISPLGGAALALTGALAAAGFVKAFGIPFLGMPRTRHAEEARESSPSMIAGMVLLAASCLLLGIFPGVVIGFLSPVVLALTGAYGMEGSKVSLLVGETGAALYPQGILLTMVIMAAATAVFVVSAGGKRKTTYGPSWDCGILALNERMQYTAAAFTKPLKLIFKKIYLPKRELKVTYTTRPFFVKSIQYRGKITPFVERYLYEPVTGFIQRNAAKVRLVQSGNLHLYLGYILMTLILLLIFGN